MRFKLSLILLFFTFLNVFCQITKDAILGKWMATDKSVAVSVYKEGNSFRAKVIWFDERLGSGKPMNSRVDIYNPDISLRHRKIIGMDILEGLQFDTEKQRYENGKIYDASSGRIWDAYVEIKEGNHLCVRGFWKWPWIGKTLYFVRS